ncbi:lipase family protein [Streptoverticillium reticulum]|uniref:lipase family protein n=1 Tax=Streptomyces TaxID=1883 RepID=UPI001D129E23|nr:lipase family protein [Streptomyces sp. ET3-23]MCC2277151.1 lipase family protein [Streptomyces sp. ET3-23]
MSAPVPVFDHSATAYSPRLAYAMALASRLAYEAEADIERQAAAWGFERVRHHCTRFTPPFPLEDTQAFTMAGDRMIVTAFRGTEPRKLRDWLSDVEGVPWPGPGGLGYVHFGFGEALHSIFADVQGALAELRDKQQTVWLTGHSLGGALAMLAGCRLHFEEPYLTADGIYTFGQPRTCDRALADAHDKAFAGRMYRFVNDKDVVPHLPPEPLYWHAQALRHIDAVGAVRESVGLLGGFGERMEHLGHVAKDMWDGAGDAFRDHGVAKYVAALERLLVQGGPGA